uniref:Leucine rich repeat containing 19 n=1 Tax=Varanus komodoensis TaxID=61221 RepID=A0A8D2KZ65_VARKO
KFLEFALFWTFSFSIMKDAFYVRCDESSKNYSSIPSKLNKNVSVLNLSYNNIALNETDTDILYNYTNIKELYLNNNVIVVLCNYSFQSLSELAILDVSSNSITTIEQAAFFGLNKLMTLQLQNNEIEQLDFTAVRFLKNLQVLNLQNNHLKYVAINVSLNSDETILSGNPWYCLCGLYVSGVQSWLNDTNIKIGKYPQIICVFAWCRKTNDGARRTSLGSAFHRLGTTAEKHFGKSWTFLMGVLVVVSGTTSLIIMAIKFPKWYQYLISYNHRRLEEDEPEMFEETFAPHMRTFPATPDSNEDESIVVFEQFHTFVPEEDGFIEDKYIDS